jgi:probable rRNA maturation factor
MMKPFQIAVQSFVRRLPLNERRIVHLAERIFRAEGIKQAELSIAVVGDKRMADFAERYAHRRYRTDVFAFNLSEGGKKNTLLVGQIIVNSQLARDQAKKMHADPAAELALYITHGILHLAGYDDHRRKDAQQMHDRSLRHLKNAGFTKIPPMPVVD